VKSKERDFKARKMELKRSWSFTIDPKRTQKAKPRDTLPSSWIS
jgi:hypothetical protein